MNFVNYAAFVLLVTCSCIKNFRYSIHTQELCTAAKFHPLMHGPHMQYETCLRTGLAGNSRPHWCKQLHGIVCA